MPLLGFWSFVNKIYSLSLFECSSKKCCHCRFQDVKIYSVLCLNQRGSDHFYRQLAEITGGKHLRLEQFQNVVDMLIAICYGENLGLK